MPANGKSMSSLLKAYATGVHASNKVRNMASKHKICVIRIPMDKIFRNWHWEAYEYEIMVKHISI